MKTTTALVAFVLALGGTGWRVHAQQPSTILITGSNRGLGLEFTKQYAAAGWNVVATARDTAGAKELRELAARNPRVTLEKLDLLDRASIKTLAAKYRGRPIDGLLNNGGLLGDMKTQQLGSLDYKQFEEVMAVNVYAPLAGAEPLQESGAASQQKKIVSMTSRSGVISLPGWRGPYFYRASKIGLNRVSRMLADDLRDKGIIVATISPPPTETDMLRALIGADGAARQAKPADVIARLIKVIDGQRGRASGGQEGR